MNEPDVYLTGLIQRFWDYAEREFGLDPAVFDSVERRDDRPPVFRKKAAGQNILNPPDAAPEVRAAIEGTVPMSERHRHFGSMRSSQALAQSVFGSLAVLGKVGALEGLVTEEGLPAFPDADTQPQVTLECAVTYLGEPRPTSIDVWFEGTHRLAVECKLTEPEFGTCSRPKLREGKDANYERDYCDGTYTRQRDRNSRCSLTEIGIRYWTYVPEFFDWDHENDLRPCPLSNTYQLVRNILAACVLPDGSLDANGGFALVIYDERNPAFQEGGDANRQWREAKGGLKRPELLRRCSWQRLAAHLSNYSGLGWLVSGLADKYGLVPRGT